MRNYQFLYFLKNFGYKNPIAFLVLVFTLGMTGVNVQRAPIQAKDSRQGSYSVFKAFQWPHHGIPHVFDTLQHKSYRLCFELNKKENDILGLPISSSERKDVFVNFNPLDTAVVDLEEGEMKIYPLTKDTIYIKYQEQRRVITGAFIIPSYHEVRYAFTYSPITFMPVEVRPYFCYCPLRCGIWKYKLNGETKTIEYKFTIDTSLMKKY